MTLGGLAGAARCRLASRRGEEHRGHDRRQILSCGWVSIHLVVNDEITKDRTLANPLLRPLWATCVTVVRHSRQRGKAGRTLRRTEEGERGRRRRRRGRGQERTGEKRKRKGGAGMRMCTRVGSGHTRCSRKCPELLELPAELKPARETESNEWSDHGEFPKNYPRVMNLRGVGNPRPCVEPVRQK